MRSHIPQFAARGIWPLMPPNKDNSLVPVYLPIRSPDKIDC